MSYQLCSWGVARSVSFLASVLDTLSQYCTVSHQPLSHTATMDFATFSPFMTVDHLTVSPRHTLIVRRSCTVLPQGPQHTCLPALTICATTDARAAHFPASYPMVAQSPSMFVSLSTSLSPPALVLSQPPTLPQHRHWRPYSRPIPIPRLHPHAPSRHTPMPVLPSQTKPASAPAHVVPSFRLRCCSPTMTRSGVLMCPRHGGQRWTQGKYNCGGGYACPCCFHLVPPPVISTTNGRGKVGMDGMRDVGNLSSCPIVLNIKVQCLIVTLMLISSHRCNGKRFRCPPTSFSVRCLNIV